MSEPEFPPYTFADPKGRRWTLKINYGLKCSIKDTTGVDISRIAVKGLKAMGALLDDDEKFMQALWILVEEQATILNGITPEEFAKCFDGPTYEAASAALWASIVLFSQPHSRETMHAALEKAKQVAERTGALAIESIDVESESRKLIGQSGSVQES